MNTNFAQFFSTVQEAKWYHQFLTPVMALIPAHSKLLDIGTGSGKMLALLAQAKKIDPTGIDTDEQMLEEASKKLHGLPVQLTKIQPNEPLPFENDDFDNLTICNVLFHLKREEAFELLDESRRVLRPNGKIIILTPTGKGGFIKLMRHFSMSDYKTIFIWYRATKSKAISWTEQQLLADYCAERKLNYEHKKTLQGFAQLEIISSR